MSIPSNTIPTKLLQLPEDPAPSTTGYLMYSRGGVTYKVLTSDLITAAGTIPSSRQIIAGTGMTGGGDLSANRTLSIAAGGVGSTQLAITGVAAGVYGNSENVPQVTVDAQGRITSVSNIPFSVTGFVPTTRQVIAGTGLTGGGELTVDRTFYVDLATETPLSVNDTGEVGVSSKSARQDHRHPAIELADDTQVNGLLGLGNGGTAKSIVPAAGAMVYSGADGLYVGSVGVAGQVPVSTGAGAPTWGSAVLIGDQAANLFYAGPSSGPAAPVGFRTVVVADVPTLNQDSSGSAGSLKSTATTGKMTVTGPGVATTRAMTVPDMDFTVATGGGTATGANTDDNAVNSLYSGLVTNANHSGDATGATALTLATVNTSVGVPGAFGSATDIPVVTVNAKGLVTAISTVAVTIPSSSISVTGGDLTLSGNTGTAITNATLVNVATGAVTGSSTEIPVITFNNKGLVTSITTAVVVAPADTLTGATLASGVTASSLTSVGTLTGGATGAGFTVALTTSTITGALPAAQMPALTGDVTMTAGQTVTVLAAGSASNLNAGLLATARGGTGVDNSTGGTANQFWARPDGATGAAAYRAVVAADIPTLNQNTTGSAATVTTNANLTGDVTSSGSNATTLAAGSAGNLNSGTLLAARMPALTGDITTTVNAVATTLATVNTNTGQWGSATASAQITLNGKGLATAAANVTITPAVGSITGFGANIATALGVAIGSAGAPVLFDGAGGTPSSFVLTNASGQIVAGISGGTF